jgi:hypothetical protein
VPAQVPPASPFRPHSRIGVVALGLGSVALLLDIASRVIVGWWWLHLHPTYRYIAMFIPYREQYLGDQARPFVGSGYVCLGLVVPGIVLTMCSFLQRGRHVGFPVLAAIINAAALLMLLGYTDMQPHER